MRIQALAMELRPAGNKNGAERRMVRKFWTVGGYKKGGAAVSKREGGG